MIGTPRQSVVGLFRHSNYYITPVHTRQVELLSEAQPDG